jgi:hypothetical protein
LQDLLNTLKLEHKSEEDRLKREHDWQLREVREECASELKHVQRQMEAVREEHEA